jgi:hypothetical protein
VITQRESKKITEAIASNLGQRFCTNCRLTRDAEGGLWTVYQGGLRRRWKCKECADNVQKRQALKGG